MQKLMNVSEVAEYLGVEKSTIYSWTFKKCIPHFKISEKCIKFDPEQIQKWLSEKQFNPTYRTEPAVKPEGKRGRGRPRHKKGTSPSLVEIAKKEILRG